MDVEHYLTHVNPAIVIWSIRAFYVLSAYAILIVRLIPDLNRRFLDYGARAEGPSKVYIQNSALPRWARIQFDPWLDWLATITVPHSWFTQFYVCSTACSAYWLMHCAILLPDLPLKFDQAIASLWECRTFICMLLLQLQGLRRLCECLMVSKPSQSRMWIGHFCIGIAFYLVTNVAIWIEPAMETNSKLNIVPHTILDPLTMLDVVRVTFCTLTFFYYSWKQFQVHKYLASLQEYRIPDHFIFIDTNLVCPHYAFEVNIYLSFTVLTARDTRIFNLTMLCATAFVFVNLAVTADMTKRWQLQKFPKQKSVISGRRKMLASIW